MGNLGREVDGCVGCTGSFSFAAFLFYSESNGSYGVPCRKSILMCILHAVLFCFLPIQGIRTGRTVFLVGKEMIRLTTITACAASLLIWSVPAYSVLQSESSDAMPEMVMPEMADPSCRPTTCGNPLCQVCPVVGHHGIGMPDARVHGGGGHHGFGFPSVLFPHFELPSPARSAQSHDTPPGQGYSQRLGSSDPEKPCLFPMAAVPTPVGQPPNSFVGGVFKPQQYQPTQPVPVGYPPVYGNGDSNGDGSYGYGYAQGSGNMQGQQGFVSDQRIVYVPYAVPPPIYMQRVGMALPMPRPPMMRRILGDANMYEYPEMPYRMYTTRGPRDFLAPNPPGIGE